MNAPVEVRGVAPRTIWYNPSMENKVLKTNQPSHLAHDLFHKTYLAVRFEVLFG